MRKITLLLLSIFLTTGIYAQSTLLAYFPFTDNAVQPGTSTSYLSTAGTQSSVAGLYLDGTHGSSAWLQASELNSFTGSSINLLSGTEVGRDLALVGTTANGKMMTMHFSTTGFQNIIVSFAMKGTGQGFNSHVWHYSLDGINFVEITGAATADNSGSYIMRSLDLSSVPAINNQPDVYLRLTVSGCPSSVGNNRFDNIQINAVPAGPDVYAPLVSGFQVIDASTLQVTFNELVSSTAQNTGNYAITGYSFTSATLSNDRVVTLSVSPALTEGNSYTMSIENVQDTAGNSMVDTTFTFTYGVAAEFICNSIAELRDKWTAALNTDATTYGDIVYKLAGEVVVTAINGTYRNQKFIQDATGAIVIDDNNAIITTALEVGDKITNLYGTLTDYYGLLQFVATENCPSAISIFNEVTPLTITVEQLQTPSYMNAHQCELIKIANASFTSTGTFSNNSKYGLTDATATAAEAVWIHIYNVPTLTGTAIPTEPKDIYGVNKINYAVYYLIPRSGNDIQTPAAIENYLNSGAIAVYPNPADNYVTITNQSNAIIKTIQIFDASGKSISSASFNGTITTVDVSSLASGIYYIRLSNDKESVTTKMIKK